MRWYLEVGPLEGNCGYVRSQGGGLLMELAPLSEEGEAGELSPGVHAPGRGRVRA